MSIKADESMTLTKDTLHLPPSAYILWSADILTQTAIHEFPKNHRRYRRIKLIEEASDNLLYAIFLFAQDKENYTAEQKKWFLERKYRVDENLKKLQVIHIKMLIKELDVI